MIRPPVRYDIFVMPKKKKIFLVEDDTDVAQSMAQAMEKMGYQVVAIVPTGEEIVEQIFKKHPDIVIMDVVLEGSLNGIETGHEIQKFLNIPIIFITGHGNIASAMKSNQRIPLMKPFSKEDLARAIETALAAPSS